MSYEISVDYELGMVVFRMYDGFSVAEYGEVATKEVLDALDDAPKPVFYVLDLTSFLPSLDDIIVGTSKGTGGENPTYFHANTRGVIFISDNAIITTAVAGLDTDAFGHVVAQVFPTMDDAVAYIRAQD